MNKRIQGIIIGFIVSALLFGGTTLAIVGTKSISVLYRDISIVIDGKEIIPKDINGKVVEPFIYEGTTFLPVRAISEALGKKVDWDAQTSTVYVGEKPESETDKNQKIALITQNSADQYWITLNEGAQKAASELGVTVTFMSPPVKNDAQQIYMIHSAITTGFNAIMIAANGPDAVSSALEEAQLAGIKIIYVDSPANVTAEATFFTDNKAAGKVAGAEMLAALKAAGKTSGKVGIINVTAAADSVVLREAGFREAFAGSNFSILETQYGEGDIVKSQSIAENFITQGVVGIFGTNEGSTIGTGNAIKSTGNKEVIGIGFDKSDTIMNLIEDDWLLCALVQNSDAMGYEGVKAAVAAIGGKQLGAMVTDTGVSILKK